MFETLEHLSVLDKLSAQDAAVAFCCYRLRIAGVGMQPTKSIASC